MSKDPIATSPEQFRLGNQHVRCEIVQPLQAFQPRTCSRHRRTALTQALSVRSGKELVGVSQQDANGHETIPYFRGVFGLALRQDFLT